MNGLRHYDRDSELPAACGDPFLNPLSSSDLLGLVANHLSTPDCPNLESAQLVYARWKRGISITTVYTLKLDDGSQHLITAKKYTGDKASLLNRKWNRNANLDMHCAPLKPLAQIPDLNLALSCFPADRQLRGIEQLLDRRQTARMLSDSGWCPPRSIKKRRMELELLRYKPEHRAVYRLRLQKREGNGKSSAHSLAARVLPPGRIEAISNFRQHFEAHSNFQLAPNLIAIDDRTGLMFESWLELDLLPPGRLEVFEESYSAGQVLGKLHRVNTPPAPRRRDPGLRYPSNLFDFDSKLKRWSLNHVPLRSSTTLTWCHGDFHPDQLGHRHSDGKLQMLDLDELSIGDPVIDLASWTADRLSMDLECGVDEAARELLLGYRQSGGERISRRELAAATACALVQKAAGILRRLESDAITKTTLLLELANEISPSKHQATSSR